MSFLEPLLLTLAAAAAVPLLLHLMRRRSGARVEFPAARYLARAEQEHSRKLRLRNLALMLLRVLLLLLVAVAAARPVGRVAGAGHPPTALAIVLDNSLSSGAVVGGQPVLTELVAAARDVATAARTEDRLWLVTADGQVTGGTRDVVLAALERATPLAGAGDPAAAVGRGASLAGSAGLDARQVVVLTDGQATSWSDPARPERTGVVAFQPPGSAPANHAVIAAEARPVRFTPRGDVVARVVGADTAEYTIRAGEQVLARGAARAGEEIVARVAPSARGWLAASVELPPDELRADDHRWLALWVGAPPAVRVDASAGPFVPTAVEALVQSERLVRGDEAVIAAADAADRLPALLFAPSSPVRLGAANRNLERLGVPWRFGQPARGAADVRGARLDGVTATFRYPLVPASGAAADTLATAGGAAWAVAGDGYVLVGSPALEEATNLPLRAGFVPWLAEVVGQHLAGAPALVVNAAPAAPVHLPGWLTGWESAVGGGQQLVAEGATTAPEEAGVYFLLRGDERVGALVVNPEPEESVLERLSPSELRTRLGARDARVLTDRGELAAAAFDPAAGRSLVSPFLAAALLVLVAEGWASRRGGGGRGR
ncbi:MAG TPA: BatA domain-containing protein [Gemmatimonadales bacterium]